MRMWKIDPKLLCRKHLLGEHVEMHMFVGCLQREKSLKKYIETGLVEIHHIADRHDLLAAELKRRNYQHKSPLPLFSSYVAGDVDPSKSIEDLMKRCEECKKRIKAALITSEVT